MKRIIEINYSQLDPGLPIMLVTAPKAVLHVALLALAQMIASRDLGNAPTNLNGVLSGVLAGASVSMAEAKASRAEESSIEEKLGASGIPPDLKAELDKIFKG